MSDNKENVSQNGDNSSKEDIDKAIEQVLHDPVKKARLLQLLGIGDKNDGNRDGTSIQRDGRTNTGLSAGYPNPYLSTLSEKSMRGAEQDVVFLPNSQSPYFPFGPYCHPLMGGFMNPQYGHHSGLARSLRKRPRIMEEEKEVQSQDQEEDRVDLLSENEFIEFDPRVEFKDSWKAPSTIVSFLDKHFNRSLSDDEREVIMKDFPRPTVMH